MGLHAKKANLTCRVAWDWLENAECLKVQVKVFGLIWATDQVACAFGDILIVALSDVWEDIDVSFPNV